MVDAVSWYDANADVVTERYERVAANKVHSWLIDLLPSRPAAILDVGAGSGRDAAWLSRWDMTSSRSELLPGRSPERYDRASPIM
jgi:ubiquinone/menaquinone biosynthesis C-methylase UbiE